MKTGYWSLRKVPPQMILLGFLRLVIWNQKVFKANNHTLDLRVETNYVK